MKHIKIAFEFSDKNVVLHKFYASARYDVISVLSLVQFVELFSVVK